MKKTALIAFMLAMLPTMLLAGGGSTTTYYAALKAQVSSKSTGFGKVYAGTSNSAGTYATPLSQSSNQSSTTQNEEKTFYAFAQANDGYEFVGWSTSDNGSNTSTANPYSTKVKCSSSSSSSPTVTTVYANFKKKTLAAFNITFETSSAGTYTVDGATPANKSGLTEAKSVTLASSDPNFLNWVVNGSAVSANPYTATCTANTTISAVFLTADMVTSVTTLSDLTAALSNAQYKKITIPSGTSLTVAKGSTVTVPSGKQLVVDGTLVVLGTVSNSGAIVGSGTLYKISYTIDQGEDELQILYAPDGSEYGKISNTTYHSGESSRYYKTKVNSNTPSVNGTVNVSTTSWGALLNGENVYAISAQTLKGVQVSLDTSVAANKITGIVGSLTTTDISSGETSGKKNWLLFADCNLKGPVRSDATTRLNFNGTIDLGGHKLTFGQPRTYSDFYGMFLNGNISFEPSTDFQNGGAIFFNCAPITVKKIKGTPTMLFYDCGNSSSASTLTFTYQSSAHRNARFYNGRYSYSFNSSYDNSYAKVYGGSFSSDPSNYLADIDKLEAVKSGSYWVVQEKVVPVDVVQIGSTPYQSLEAAINAAANGSIISLIEAVELTGTVTVPAGKNITIALDGHGMTGGKIVNNGTLLFTDSTTGKGTAASEASGALVESDIENNGTLDFVFGRYSGAIVNKTGTLTTHNGLFTGSFTKQGGTVNLNGGHFSADVENLATVEGTKVFRTGNLYSVCELPNGTMYPETLTGTPGYGVTPYSDYDFELIKDWFGNKNSRAEYTGPEWTRLAELLCFYQLFNNNGLDATLVFDRDVAKDSINLYAKSQLTLSIDLKFDLAAGTYYRALSETLIGNGYYSKTYKALWDDNIKSVAMAASDKSGNNAGTVCTAMIELWESQKVGSTTRVTNTVFIAAEKRFTIGAGSNVAMIRPEVGAATFYNTLQAAIGAVADGGTVLLANDCTEEVTATKPCTINANKFSFTGSVTADPKSFDVDEQDGGIYIVTRKDPVTKVDVDTVATQVVSNDWLADNNISTENKTDDQIKEEVAAVLNTPDTNGNAKWQNLVLGQEADKPVEVKAPVEKGTETTATIAVSFEVPKNETGEKIDTGYTVKYAFDQVDTAGDVVENGAGEAKEAPTLDFEKVTANEPTYFKMKAVLEATDESGVTAEVPVDKTIGVLKVESDAEYTILAVPWQSLGSGDIKASELVHAASLSKDDELIVYNDDGSTTSWKVDENGEWKAPVTYSQNEQGQFVPDTPVAASSVAIARGKGVWLKRSDTTKDIVMIGQPATEEVETPIAAAKSEDEPSWNLVASPKLEEVNISETFKDDANKADEIIVPTAVAPKHYTYDEKEGWGYPGEIGTRTITFGGVQRTAVITGHKTDDVRVPAGQGFWYLNKDTSNEEKKIAW